VYHFGFRKVAAGWSSLAARRAHNPKVEGSNPSPATNQIKGFHVEALVVFGSVPGLCPFCAHPVPSAFGAARVVPH
jgi:hypothetical protein